jgi:hypothetical protein
MTEPDDPDTLINELTMRASQAEDGEAMRRATDMIVRLRLQMEAQREELLLATKLIEKQQRILMEKGLIP